MKQNFFPILSGFLLKDKKGDRCIRDYYYHPYVKHKQRIEELEAELKRERTRADLWQKMVELAEEQLNIEIRKKYGAKQSIPSKNKKGNR